MYNNNIKIENSNFLDEEEFLWKKYVFQTIQNVDWKTLDSTLRQQT